MIGERTGNALARIRSALGRIEAAAPVVEQSSLRAGARHEQLRAAVAETLRDLDLLIGADGEGAGR